MTEEKKPTQVDPDVLAELKKQIVQELKDDHELKLEEARQRREQQEKEYSEYVATMKASPDPWVDVTGWSETDKGVRVELEWNNAFVDYLRAEGVSGADEDQIVQKWVTLLLRDMADQMEGDGGEYQ